MTPDPTQGPSAEEVRELIASSGRIRAGLLETIRRATASGSANLALAMSGVDEWTHGLTCALSDLQAQVEALRAEHARLLAREAECHDILSGFDAVTNPEEHPELHERAFALLSRSPDGNCENTICQALTAAEARADRAEADSRNLQESVSLLYGRLDRAEAERDEARIERDAMRMAHAPLQKSLVVADVAIAAAEERGFRAGCTVGYASGGQYFYRGRWYHSLEAVVAAYRQQQEREP